MKDAKFQIQRAQKTQDRLKENEQRVKPQNTKDKMFLKQLEIILPTKEWKLVFVGISLTTNESRRWWNILKMLRENNQQNSAHNKTINNKGEIKAKLGVTSARWWWTLHPPENILISNKSQIPFVRDPETNWKAPALQVNTKRESPKPVGRFGTDSRQSPWPQHSAIKLGRDLLGLSFSQRRGGVSSHVQHPSFSWGAPQRSGFCLASLRTLTGSVQFRHLEENGDSNLNWQTT